MSEIIKPTVGAAMSPSVVGWLNPACDYVLQAFKRPRMVEKKVSLGVDPDTKKPIVQTVKERWSGAGLKVEYCLRCEPHDVYMTKFRLPKGRTLPEVIVDPDCRKLLAVIAGKQAV